jgi:predicted enzyme involved in methoxymalonyl-ACP biosynthesis
MSLDANNDRGKIVDFILSCRVMGRKIEETMVCIVWSYARDLKLNEIYAEFIPTSKNKPCFDFWRNSSFVYNQEKNQFSWRIEQEYKLPSFIRLDMPSLGRESQNEQFV